ncbi:trans-sialidase [Trypanosoma cruzi Dm28c]|uniref:Trans-sialidase n=1 Tax=Trypanosoma cruzi Dm28c TaxID=1416333 RepID=V5AJJ1_TRYCR|nr:trans-sialidase [Trypanosoma cruzi Dm28c]
MFPHGIVVGAALTASTSVRTSRVLLGHTVVNAMRYEGMCYRSAGITIYLGKHAGNNRSKSVRAAANLHGCSFTFSTRETERVRPAPIAMHSHSHVLNGACCCFSEAGSVCQRDRRTWLAVAGVFPGTALGCRAPSVGRSPRRGRLSGIVSRLLLNAVVVVDGKFLMGGRVRVCVPPCDFSQWHSLERCMCVCLADVVLGIPISRYSVVQQWTGK